MYGWRAKIGILVPPGNPTVEAELPGVIPHGVSVHYTRMKASGATGTHAGQRERNVSQVESIDGCVELLQMLSPSVIAMAHTATSYMLGEAGEAELIDKIEKKHGCRLITAFGSSLEAFRHLDIKSIGYATPYSEETTLEGKKHIEACGINVLKVARLDNVINIYHETPERAYLAGRSADCEEADAIYLSGTGMPTLEALQQLENDTGKIVLSATSCMLWNALRISGVQEPILGFGRLLASAQEP